MHSKGGEERGLHAGRLAGQLLGFSQAGQVNEDGQPVRPNQKDEEQKGLGQEEEEAPGSLTGSRDTSRLCRKHPALGSPGILKKEKEFWEKGRKAEKEEKLREEKMVSDM